MASACSNVISNHGKLRQALSSAPSPSKRSRASKATASSSITPSFYRGLFREVLDDDGHRLRRGDRMAVCDKTFQLYQKAPYAEFFELVEAREPVKPGAAPPYDCGRTKLRHPRETKGLEYNATTEAAKCCDGGNGAGC